jgi:O-antigen ligase
MMRILESVWLVFFLAGLLLVAVFGTWAETTPFWYGAALIGVAGAGSLIGRQHRTTEAVGWGAILVLLGFSAYIGIRAYTSEVAWLARPDLAFGGTALVTYLLVATRFTGSGPRIAILLVLLLLVAGNTGLGLYQYFVDPRLSIFKPFGLRRAAEVSAGGFFESGNHFAGFLTLAGMPMLGVAVLGRGLSRTLRILMLAGFLLAGIGVGFSTSRGGALAFFTGMGTLVIIAAVLWWRNRRQVQGLSSRGAGWGLAGIAVLFLGFLALTGTNLKSVFGSSGNLTSLNGRQPLWDAALEQWQTAPLLGTGARSYEYMERGFRTLDTTWRVDAGEIDALFAHNDYLQCLADYGLFGLALTLLVAGSHVWRALRSALKAPLTSLPAGGQGLATGLAAGATAGIAGLMAQAVWEFNLHIGCNAVMTGLLLGWMATPGFARSEIHPEIRSRPSGAAKEIAGTKLCHRRLAIGGLAAAVSLLLIHAAWRLAPADFTYRKALKQTATATTLPELIAVSGTFQRATALDPQNAVAWQMRGLVTLHIASMTNEKYATPFYETALVQLQQCLALYPKNPYAAA